MTNSINEAILNRIDELSKIEFGWSGELDEKPIPPDAIHIARLCLPKIMSFAAGLKKPGIFPSYEGTIQIEWLLNNKIVSLDFVGDNSPAFYVLLSTSILEEPEYKVSGTLHLSESNDIACLEIAKDIISYLNVNAVTSM